MIKCPKCGLVSHHPKDEEQRFCAACNQFHDTMKDTETSHAEPRAQTLGMLLKWRDQMIRDAGIYTLSEMVFTTLGKNPEAAQLCRDMVRQAESNAKRMEKIIIGFNAPKP